LFVVASFGGRLVRCGLVRGRLVRRGLVRRALPRCTISCFADFEVFICTCIAVLDLRAARTRWG
jgi:hypothetical protein